jgi:DNA (cytosine-5)-methyltransferase 1
MIAFYNDIDEYCAQWLRNLIDAGEIMPGVVDTRSISEIDPDELKAYTQVHLFAGLGGWALAARLAGWPDDRQLWTGSAPCQPWANIGLQRGERDERHLWPATARLIDHCRPPLFVGEQVADAIGKGWLDGVFTDLESLSYACQAVVLPACAVDAPHKRNRIYFIGALGDAECARLERYAGYGNDARERPLENRPIAASDFRNSQSIGGFDGRCRRIPEPAIPLLDHGVSADLGAIKAFGNAIVPQLGAAVLGAWLDCIDVPVTNA